MNLSFGAARALSSGTWQGALTAADARTLPGAPLKIAGPHVVLIAEPARNGTELTAPYRGVSVLATAFRFMLAAAESVSMRFVRTR